MDDATKAARAAIMALGIDARLADLVTLNETPGLDERAPSRGLLEIAFHDGQGRRRMVASVSTPTMDDALTLCSDVRRFGEILVAVRRALPMPLRSIPLPAAIEVLPDAIGQDKAHVRRTARRAARKASHAEHD